MSFFETLLALMLVAILLLRIARRLHLPYPALLAAAGVAVAMVPSTPSIPIDPHTTLALFIAPVLIDAAYDFPLGAARRLLAPLLLLAVVAVVATATLIAEVAAMWLGLPLAAGLVLGAIVAPPDAAAATAVLTNLPVSRRIDAVLKGESLFNDATALLLFAAALTIQQRGGLDAGTAVQLGLAAPGGIALGVVYGFVARRLTATLDNSVGGTLFQFVQAFVIWILAEKLHLSAVLATVASAMTIAAMAGTGDSPRMRVHSYAVWTTVVFLLNVLAFLLMGMQARTIMGEMGPNELRHAAAFAGVVVAVVIAVRLAVVFGYRWALIARGRDAVIRPGETLLIGWTGMRGLVTLATAFALPADFPERNSVVLAAFAVVLATLVIQGATLAPLIRWLGLARTDEAARELAEARAALADAALDRLNGERGAEADQLRDLYRELHADQAAPHGVAALDRRRGLTLAAVLAQRRRLDELRTDGKVGADAYLALQEELDWKQLSVLSEEDRRIAEA